MEKEKKKGRTWSDSGGKLHCNECCNGDRCDDSSHYYRPNCPYCLGTGINASTEPTEESDNPKFIRMQSYGKR